MIAFTHILNDVSSEKSAQIADMASPMGKSEMTQGISQQWSELL